MPIPAEFTPQAIRDRVDRICNGLEPNLGLFPLGAPLRVIGRHVTLEGFGGFRALMHQISNPVIGQGVTDHSKFAQNPFGRLLATQHFLTDCNYGDRTAVAQAIEHYAKGHERVFGAITAATCPDRAGETYSAWQDKDRAWVLGTTIEAMIVAFETIRGVPLTADERNAVWQDGQRIGAVLLVDFSTFAPTYRELRRWMATRVSRVTFGRSRSSKLRPNLHIHTSALAISAALFEQLNAGLGVPEAVAHRMVPPALWPLIPFGPGGWLGEVEYQLALGAARVAMAVGAYRPEWHAYKQRTDDPT